MAPQLTDRAVMQKTLLVGTPVIDRKSVAQRIVSSRAGGERRKSIDANRWTSVMKAGLAGCSVATCDSEEGKVKMAPVPDDVALRHKYHNELMTLCGITLRQLVEAMQSAKKAAQQREETAKRAAPARSRSRSRQPDARDSS